MIATRLTLATACAAALAATAPAAAQDVRVHRGEAGPGVVTVHHGVAGAARRGYGAEGYGAAPWGLAGAGFAPIGYWESNYGREDDAAIFAARYGCARPIWNAKYNRYTAPCN